MVASPGQGPVSADVAKRVNDAGRPAEGRGSLGSGNLGPEALSARQPCIDTRLMTSATGDGIAVLDKQTCWQLLAGEEVGRLAVSVRRHPDMFPVNYTVDDQTIVFRTAEGTKLFALFVNSAVAFEVDRYDAESGTAWSVVLKGHAAEIPMQDLSDDLAFPLFPWTATPKPRFVRVVPEEISGRRFLVVAHRPGLVGGVNTAATLR